ncbi:hypothetical protein BsIDN1_18840 [Bacillus safensis]|uniref:HTH tetR-type domain-containing protein n=1 Tax=Bacillus safensis TaxID=561879 RepID=A0A5S9M9P4_BACIA|nr:hypothetical protein BsIDN1_18840 [Bacillus safensis]
MNKVVASGEKGVVYYFLYLMTKRSNSHFGSEIMSVDRRQMILDGATKAFTQFGYKATTMDLVAKLANVGKGTIYTFFKKTKKSCSMKFSHPF